MTEHEKLVASISITPVNWKIRVADYMIMGEEEKAQEVLDAVAISAEDAINQVNVIAVRHDLQGHWI